MSRDVQRRWRRCCGFLAFAESIYSHTLPGSDRRTHTVLPQAWLVEDLETLWSPKLWIISRRAPPTGWCCSAQQRTSWCSRHQPRLRFGCRFPCLVMLPMTVMGLSTLRQISGSPAGNLSVLVYGYGSDGDIDDLTPLYSFNQIKIARTKLAQACASSTLKSANALHTLTSCSAGNIKGTTTFPCNIKWNNMNLSLVHVICNLV